MSSSKTFLTLPEVARLLRVTPARAYQMCHAGGLPHVRRGRRILVPADAWKRWVEEQTERALSTVTPLRRPKEGKPTPEVVGSPGARDGGGGIRASINRDKEARP